MMTDISMIYYNINIRYIYSGKSTTIILYIQKKKLQSNQKSPDFCVNRQYFFFFIRNIQSVLNNKISI